MCQSLWAPGVPWYSDYCYSIEITCIVGFGPTNDSVMAWADAKCLIWVLNLLWRPLIGQVFLSMLSGVRRCWFSWKESKALVQTPADSQLHKRLSVHYWVNSELSSCSRWKSKSNRAAESEVQTSYQSQRGLSWSPHHTELPGAAWCHFSAYQTGNITELPQMSDKCQMILQMKRQTCPLVWMLGTDSSFL